MNELFLEVFHNMPRQGPGTDDCTLQALETLRPFLPIEPVALDMGCGTGASTMVLARHCKHVTATDLDGVMLDTLQQKTNRAGLSTRITTVRASMDEPDFPLNSFDLIWSEGAIYNMGFAAGLNRWRQLLKPRACMAVTEACWLTPAQPAEIVRFWEQQYPAIMPVSGNLAVAASCGYRIVDHFTLPTRAWNENFYHHMRSSMDAMRKRHPDDPEAASLHEALAEEIRMYETYHAHYGYVFFLLQRTD